MYNMIKFAYYVSNLITLFSLVFKKKKKHYKKSAVNFMHILSAYYKMHKKSGRKGKTMGFI